VRDPSGASWWFIALMLCFVSLGLLEAGMRLRDNRRAEGWERTTGVVVENREVLRDGPRGEVCSLRLRYRYTVAGRAYRGRMRWPGDRGGCGDAHFRGPAPRPGEAVAVYFDPRRPRVSALARRHPVHRGEVVSLLFSQLFFWGLLLADLAFGWRARRRAAAPA
jgi:hypothetical protein